MATTTTTTSIDPDIKRAVLPVLGDVTRLYREGALGAIADTEGVKEALRRQQELALQTMQGGLGSENLLRKLQGAQGALLGQSQGALGSARAARGREAGLADRAMELQAADLEARNRAMTQYGKSAEGARALEQETLDAPALAAERFFGYLGAAPQGSISTTKGPSGGK